MTDYLHYTTGQPVASVRKLRGSINALLRLFGIACHIVTNQPVWEVDNP